MPLSGYFSVRGTHSPLLLASFCCQGPFLHNVSWVSSSGLNPACPLLFCFLSTLHPSVIALTWPHSPTTFIAVFLVGPFQVLLSSCPLAPPALHALTVCNPSAFPWSVLSFSKQLFTPLHHLLHPPPFFPFQLMTLFLVYSEWKQRENVSWPFYIFAHIYIFFFCFHPCLCSFLWSRLLIAPLFHLIQLVFLCPISTGSL